MTDANGRTTEEGPLAVMVGRADNDGSGSGGGDGDNLAVRTHETGGNLAGRQRHALAATCIYKCDRDRAGAPRAAEVAAAPVRARCRPFSPPPEKLVMDFW